MANDHGPSSEPGLFLVGVIDLLGQSAKLLRLENRHRKEKDSQDVYARRLRAVTQRINEVRGMFDGSVRAMNRDLCPMAPDDDSRQRFLDEQGLTLPRRHFSDMIVLHACIDDSRWETPRNSIIADLAGAMLWSMARRVPMRGGLELGMAVEMPEGDVYGYPAMRAHQIESEMAGYPRVVVGENLRKHVDQWVVTKLTMAPGRISGHAQMAITFSNFCRKFFEVDQDDGLTFLDYLGEGARERAPDNNATRQMFKDAYQFVVQKHTAFRSRGDAKLAARYARLRRYYESRQHFWT